MSRLVAYGGGGGCVYSCADGAVVEGVLEVPQKVGAGLAWGGEGCGV